MHPYPFFPLIHWITIHTGSQNMPGVAENYNFFSGFGSDLTEYVIIVAILTGLYHLIRRHNCEVYKCWRIGLHKTAAGHYTCMKHHPLDRITHEHILREHFKALGRDGDGGDV